MNPVNEESNDDSPSSREPKQSFQGRETGNLFGVPRSVPLASLPCASGKWGPLNREASALHTYRGNKPRLVRPASSTGESIVASFKALHMATCTFNKSTNYRLFYAVL